MSDKGSPSVQPNPAATGGRTVTFASPALPKQAELVGFHGREALGRPYRFDLGLSAPEQVEVDMVGALGHRGTLELDRGPATPPLVVHGVVAAIEMVAHHPGRTLYLASLVPQIWQLGLTHHSRIFTDASVVEIIEAVLRHSGLAAGRFAFKLSGSYPKLEHVCQYRESNLAFISRLMEREGMYYFFEQCPEVEKLVITDDRVFHHELGSGLVQFAPWQGQQSQSGVEVLHKLSCQSRALPTRVVLHDYDYLNPSLDLHCDASVARSSPGHIVLYGENYQQPSVGQRYAEVRAQELLARQSVFQAAGHAFDVRPGFVFKLEQHPMPSLNASYLVTELEHWGKQISGVEELDELLGLEGDDIHRIALEAISSDVQFRPRRTAPWPRIDGVVDGVVDGPAVSPYAQIDEGGRYKVRIFFDESDLTDGSASTWIRMLQPHGGGTEGMHFPLRKDTEVHIAFLGGDPDRPVIVGVAPNTQKPSKVTGANYSQNVIMTGGSNRLEMEDMAGSQYIDLSCPVHNTFMHFGSPTAGKHAGGFAFVTSTEGRWKQYSAGDRLLEVDSFSVETVQGDVTQSYKAKLTTDVIGVVTVGYHSSHDWTIDGPVTWWFKDTFDQTIGGDINQRFQATLTQDIAGDVTISVRANVDETVDGRVSYETGPIAETHYGPKATSIMGTHLLTAIGTQGIHSDAKQTISAPEQEIKADGAQALKAATHTVEASSSIAAQAPEIGIDGSGTVTIKSGNITIEGGDVTIKGGNLTIEHGPVSVTGSAVSVDGGGEISMGAGVIKLN